jgi:hypothetical protein
MSKMSYLKKSVKRKNKMLGYTNDKEKDHLGT